MSFLSDFKNKCCINLHSITILALIIVSVIAIAACGERGNDSEEADTPVTSSVQTQTGPRDVPVSGSLVFPNTASLSFESPGIVGDVLVNEGDVVQSGQPLASLDALSISRLTTAVAARS